MALNKSDLLPPESPDEQRIERLAPRDAESSDNTVLVSALTGDGVDDLLHAIQSGLASAESPLQAAI